MALTILSEPEVLTPAFNPVVYKFKSNQQTLIDFAYLVSVQNYLGTTISTLKIPGGSNNNHETEIDISDKLRTLQSFGSWRYNVTGSEYVYFDPAFRPAFRIEIQEYYSGSIQSTHTDIYRWTIPAALSSIRFPYWNYEDVNVQGRWLTNFDSMKARRADKLTLSYLQPSLGTIEFKYKFYNASGVLLYSGAISVPSSEPGDVFHVHAGLYDLKIAHTLSDFIYNNTAYYTISADNFNPKRIDVISKHCKYDGVVMHFLNEWGAVDSFVFNLAARRGVSIVKMKAKLNKLSTPLKPSIFGVGTSPYVVKYTDNLKLTSDYLTDNDSNALLEMFTSPIIAIECYASLFFPSIPGNKIILPCDLELTNYDIKQKPTDKLHNLEIDVKISVDNTRQSL